MSINRKEFLSSIAWGSGSLALFSSFGFVTFPVSDGKSWKAIVIDYSKCAGCRTCEMVCSENNHRLQIEGTSINGQGNPELSNIRVWRFHPPSDVAVTCFLCHDAPCVEACPVKPHAETGRKALYRDEVLGTIKSDYDRCIGCQSCATACRLDRAGIIYPDDEGSPTGMCTLCNGDPSCVKWCPFDALAYLEITDDMSMRNMKPEQIANMLFEKFYDKETMEKHKL